MGNERMFSQSKPEVNRMGRETHMHTLSDFLYVALCVCSRIKTH